MTDIIEIRGGAGPEEAGAITAIIAHLLDDARAAAARPATAPRPSPWVQSWRPRELHEPLPSHVYDSRPWLEDIDPG